MSVRQSTTTVTGCELRMITISAEYRRMNEEESEQDALKSTGAR